MEDIVELQRDGEGLALEEALRQLSTDVRCTVADGLRDQHPRHERQP